MRIPDYPAPDRALDGAELLPIWEDGQQRSIPIQLLWSLAAEENPAFKASSSGWLLSPATRLALAAIVSPINCQAAYLAESGREGEFVFSSANLSAQVAADTLQGIYVAPASDTTGASGAWVRKLSVPVAHVKFWGAAGVAGDDAPAINAAMAYLNGIGGGVLWHDAINYSIGSTVDNKYPRVLLMGTGDEQTHDSGTPVRRTRYLATFAGTTVKVRTPYASEQGVVAAQTYKYAGAGIKGIMLDGNQIGTMALLVDTVDCADIDVFATGYVGSTVFEVNCGVTGTDLGEACDVQQSRMVFRARQIGTTAERNSDILTLNGSSNANVSGNVGPANGISVYAQHWNGNVLVGYSADNNDVCVMGFRAGGTGKLILGKGKTASVGIGFSNNNIVFASGIGAIYLEGTDTAGVTVGATNTILTRDVSNSTPAPTAGTGSNWVDYANNGVLAGMVFKKLAMGDTSAAALAALASLGNETLRVRNTAQDHVILDDGTNVWGVSIDGSGNLRFVRVTGTGLLNLGGSVSIPVSALINAANDGAAATAGVAINQLYRNGSILMVRVA